MQRDNKTCYLPEIVNGYSLDQAPKLNSHRAKKIEALSP